MVLLKVSNFSKETFTFPLRHIVIHVIEDLFHFRFLFKVNLNKSRVSNQLWLSSGDKSTPIGAL